MSGEIGDDKVKFALEVWKTTIAVQQHFNTIEMQIRSIAVTVLTATLSAAALVFNKMQGTDQGATARGILSVPDMIVLAGLFAWAAFYFMDRWGYHRLLHGAVKQAEAIEKKIGETDYGAIMSLSTSISDASPLKWRGKARVHSGTKIDFFYGGVAAVLILVVFLVF